MEGFGEGARHARRSGEGAAQERKRQALSFALPLLAHFFALKFAVPLLMPLDIVAFPLFGARVRERIQYREIGWLAPFIVIGMAAGLTLLIEVAEQILLVVLGSFLLPALLGGAWLGNRLHASVPAAAVVKAVYALLVLAGLLLLARSLPVLFAL